MNLHDQTIASYNQHAADFAQKFDNLGARVSDIDEVLAIVTTPNPFVLEIGCANGRDAAEICTHTSRYIGLDPSEQLITIARQRVPQAEFVVTDAIAYDFPAGLDIIFAFASLLHIPKDSLKQVITKALAALNDGGVLRLSLKAAPQYQVLTKTDEYGTRTYYLYSPDDIQELATGWQVLLNEIENFRGQSWLKVMLQKSTL